MKNVKNLFRCISVLTLFVLCGAFAAKADTVSGTVVDDTGEPLIGVSVLIKGANAGVTTDIDGNYAIQVPNTKAAILSFSYVGMETQEIRLNGRTKLDVTLKPNSNALEEVVVVGYGQQKKASVVGAITQTTGDVLARAAGVHDIGAALTGNLPGVVTTQSSGMPGDEEPEITIRGASSWNGSAPLVLVDGIERPMSSVDMSSVETISALKDASATAVYGVKGANGVILITTKRGSEGKAKIDVGFTATMKTISKLPTKYDSYDAMLLHNHVIENELALSPDSWNYIVPMDRVNKYRYRTSLEDIERYPNVDWRNELFKDAAMSYNAYVNISGGTKFVRYYAAVDFVSEGDLFRSFDSGRGYNAGFDYNRLNVRSNLDFSLTPTTTFKVNIAGSNGTRKTPYNSSGMYTVEWSAAQAWAGVYSTPPDIFMPVYSDGSLGYYPLNASQVSNSVRQIMTAGTMTMTNTRINTDFVLEQDLSFITKGLNFRGMISWDNLFVEGKRGIEDTSNYMLKWIDPATGQIQYNNTYDNTTKFDYRTQDNLTLRQGEIQNGRTQRHTNYQLQLNWNRTFNNLHSVGATGVWTRQEDAYGSEIPRYREDWVFRTTYDYDGRYLIEYNGAYNGSEKFGKGYRFGFFNSGAIGWRISGEKFFKPLLPYVNNLKVRASYGEIGDDTGDRWLYMDQWAYGGNAIVDGSARPGNTSPYTFYYQSVMGNPDAHWEKVTKMNLGIDYGFLNDMFAGSLEFFKDKRKDILIAGSQRSVPSYFGGTAPTANLGRAQSTGYELELRFNYPINRDMRVWANFNMTHAANKILDKDDPQLRPAYQKAAGYAIGQQHAHIDAGFLNNYDMIYGAPAFETNDGQRLPGDYYIVDFNGDGVIDANDSAPYGYTGTPQNTYNATLGFEWKGFSVFAQFYGVTNVTRSVDLRSFENQMNNAYELKPWWNPDGSGEMLTPRWLSTPYANAWGTQWLYDGSYVRLKNVEIAYTWTAGWIKKIGLTNLKVYLNGNNLWLWTRMPDDRESNGSYAASAYPTTRRFNLGVKFSL